MWHTVFEIIIATLSDPSIQTALVSLLLTLLALAATFLGLPVWLIAVIRIIIEKGVPVAVRSLEQDKKLAIKSGAVPFPNNVIHSTAFEKVKAKIPLPLQAAAVVVMPALKEEIHDRIKMEVEKMNADRDRKYFAPPTAKELGGILG